LAGRTESGRHRAASPITRPVEGQPEAQEILKHARLPSRPEKVPRLAVNLSYAYADNTSYAMIDD
jgi:hypothetical protein